MYVNMNWLVSLNLVVILLCLIVAYMSFLNENYWGMTINIGLAIINVVLLIMNK